MTGISKTLVTGASGFLGTSLCAKLREAGAEIHATSRRDSPDAIDGVRWWQSNLEDVAEVRRLLSNLRTTARYDIALSQYEHEAENLPESTSADVRTHRIGGNVNWSPTPASWVQSDVTYVLSTTDTPAS